MASTIGGQTLHQAGNLPRPGEKADTKLSHTDIDLLFTQNERLRWILIDEISMVADELLGVFEQYLSDAACNSIYRKRRDKSFRIFGGYNLLLFGDWWQLPPIPDSAALFRPVVEETKRNGTGDDEAIDIENDSDNEENYREQYTETLLQSKEAHTIGES